jgi:hypothetical protein
MLVDELADGVVTGAGRELGAEPGRFASGVHVRVRSGRN